MNWSKLVIDFRNCGITNREVIDMNLPPNGMDSTYTVDLLLDGNNIRNLKDD